jgi:hypothetical protein
VPAQEPVPAVGGADDADAEARRARVPSAAAMADALAAFSRMSLPAPLPASTLTAAPTLLAGVGAGAFVYARSRGLASILQRRRPRVAPRKLGSGASQARRVFLPSDGGCAHAPVALHREGRSAHLQVRTQRWRYHLRLHALIAITQVGARCMGAAVYRSATQRPSGFRAAFAGTIATSSSEEASTYARYGAPRTSAYPVQNGIVPR